MEIEEKIITLATYYDPMLAQIVRTRLEDSGIPCSVDDSMSVYPIYTNALGGIKVKIFERDLEQAKALLAEDAALPVEKTIEDADISVVCPYCGSNNVRYALSLKDDTNWFTRTWSALFSALPLAKDKDWHCFNCGKDFE